MAAQYLVKQRQFEGLKYRAFGGCVRSYGKWRTLKQFDGKDEAGAHAEKISRIGLQETAVFYRGEKIWSNRE
jgi:hypothetical protein